MCFDMDIDKAFFLQGVPYNMKTIAIFVFSNSALKFTFYF